MAQDGGRERTYKSTVKTLSILKGHVRVVPSAAILADLELIGLHLTWSQRTLSNTRNTILCNSVELTNAMPVDGSTVVSQIVCDVNLQGVTPVGLYTRYQSVHELSVSADSQGLPWKKVRASPLTKRVGPGTVPLNVKQVVLYPSGEQATCSTLSQYSRVTPVSGTVSCGNVC